MDLSRNSLQQSFRSLADESGEEELNRCKFTLSKIEFGWRFLFLWMAVLGLLSAVAEALLHFLEERFESRQTNMQFLRRLYKELTILGMMSFVLILVRDFSPNLTKNEFQIIEFAHLWIFAVGISFIAQGIQAALSLRNSKTRWDNSFAFGLKRIEEKYSELMDRRKCGLHCLSRQEGYLVQKVRLWIMRKHFLLRHNLPQSFEFSKYLRKNLTKHVLRDMEIGWESWIFLCITFLIGYLISLAVEEEGVTKPLDTLTASVVSLCVTTIIALCTIGLLISIEAGTVRFLRITGVEKPYDVADLLRHAKSIYQAERNDLIDPTGCLTADEFRLDTILAEEMNKDHIDSPEYMAKHKVFDVIEVAKFKEKGVLPLSYPVAFVTVFRVIMLSQGYVFGLTLLLVAQHANGSALAYGLVALEFAMHLVMVSALFPRVVRNFALLSAVCLVDEDALNLIEDSFLYQQRTNDSIYILSTVLYKVFETLLGDETTEPIQDLHTKVEFTIQSTFNLLDKDSSGIVTAKQLHLYLEENPFRHYMQLRRIRMVARALNAHKGFTVEHFGFLLRGMRRLKKRGVKAQLKLRKCFPKILLSCSQCGAKVNPGMLQDHANVCDDQQLSEHKLKERASLLATKKPSAFFSRGAKYGLLRPFILYSAVAASEENRSRGTSFASCASGNIDRNENHVDPEVEDDDENDEQHSRQDDDDDSVHIDL